MESEKKRARTETSPLERLFPSFHRDIYSLLEKALGKEALFVLSCVWEPLRAPDAKNDSVLHKVYLEAGFLGSRSLFRWACYNGCAFDPRIVERAFEGNRREFLEHTIAPIEVNVGVYEKRFYQVRDHRALCWIEHRYKATFTLKGMLYTIISHDNDDILRFIAHKRPGEFEGYSWENYMVERGVDALNRAKYRVLVWFFKNGYKPAVKDLVILVTRGQVDILRTYVAINPEIISKTEILKVAIRNRDLEMVKSLHQIGFYWPKKAVSYAAKHRLLDILAYARRNGCPE